MAGKTKSKLSNVKHYQRKKQFTPYKDKQIFIPGTVFGVEIPGYYYQAVIKRPDYRAGFLVVKFLDDNSQYRFAKRDIDMWMSQECTPPVDSEEVSNYAAEALISLRSGVEFGKIEEMRKLEEEEVQGRFQELFENYPGIFDGIDDWDIKSEETNSMQESRRCVSKKRPRTYCLKVKVDEICQEADVITKKVKMIQHDSNIGEGLILQREISRDDYNFHGSGVQIFIHQTSSNIKLKESVDKRVVDNTGKESRTTFHNQRKIIKIGVNQSCNNSVIINGTNSKIKNNETSNSQSNSSFRRNKPTDQNNQHQNDVALTPRRSKRLSMQ
eukprot:TRINITY_DN32274_c0_g1_i1.p2 TRINITY_DN32274_c0_g1~~TRINITY_DN32274_c0_g1_i1.p2  ORF type:complete len:347 (+),score=25.30 TRINITY_DN32274_c0_g1_i1:61-1041(+)